MLLHSNSKSTLTTVEICEEKLKPDADVESAARDLSCSSVVPRAACCSSNQSYGVTELSNHILSRHGSILVEI